MTETKRTATPAIGAPGDSPMLGIGLKVISVGLLLTMASLLKASEGVPPGELVFFRSLFALPPIFIFLASRGELAVGIRTRRPLWHLTRGLVGTMAMGTGFLALTSLPLPEAVALSYTMPLLIVLFSAVFLKEQVRIYRWSAMIVGFIGVGIITAPRLNVFSGGFQADVAAIGVIAALFGACFGATAQLIVRQMVQVERAATIVLYFSATSTLVSLVTLPFGWVMPSPAQWAMLIGAGIFGGIGQIFLTSSYRHADVSVIAPFEYTSLILSLLVGYFVFGDVPSAAMIAGSVVVVAAGIFIIFRERQLGLERGKARALISRLG